MAEHAKPDGRREAGERTRKRLLVAARGLLAERGEEAVTLRDITDAACANVAAVSYHFGSKEALCRAAIAEAIETCIQAQVDGLGELGDAATLEDIAAAWARPMVGALCGPADETQALLRIVARAYNDSPPCMGDWKASAVSRSEAALLPHLRRALPGVPDEELRFRAECAGSMVHAMAGGNMRADLEHKSADELEHLLVPVVAGTFAGAPAHAR
jgi:AcrR family transcriptional regulator